MTRKTQAARPKGDETPRERIVTCAIERLATHGFEATTMRMLGDAAGLDNSSLYRHFASKADLVNAVLDHVVEEFASTTGLQNNLAHPATPKLLEDMAAIAGTYLFDQPAHARLLMHWLMSNGMGGAGFTLSVPVTDTTRPGGRILGVLRDWLADGARRGVLREHTMPDFLIILLGAILLRPATYGHLLASIDPRRSHVAARKIWEQELRATIRGALAP